MKKIIFLLLAAIAGFYYLQSTGFDNPFYFSYCDQPIKLVLGSIDKRFGLSEAQVKSDIEDAAQIWNNAYGKDLVVYDDTAELSVNFVYDERQALDTRIKNLQGELDAKKGELTPEIRNFEKRAEDFKKRVSDLNAKIEYWNSRGGAPEEEYKKLAEEQKSLQTEAEALNEQARGLNRSTEDYNREVGKLNQTVDVFKEAVQNKPEEGLYLGDQNRIEIFFVNEKSELVHTLAHEMGHAIGLGHVENPNSIMYSFTNKLVQLSNEDVTVLNEYCRQRSVLELIQLRIDQYRESAGNF